MGFLIAVLPILQAISAILTIFGLIHVGATNEVITTYGASGPDAPTAAEWMQSYGSLAIGLAGWLSTWLASRNVSTKSELLQAFMAWAVNRSDATAIRRLGFAVVDWLESVLVAKGAINEADKTEWDNTIMWLRTKLATIPANSAK